jgi:tetraacyldisaccharide 4'-kinase
MHLSERWSSNEPGDRIVRFLLAPFSELYALGWQAYLTMYRVGIKRAKRPHQPVFCVGNLVTGGTGKSPVTVYLAKLLREMGHQVVISASGYGSPSATAAQLAPDGPLSAKQWGDEPAMLRALLPGVPLIVGRRRVLAAVLCHQHFPNAVLLMDDGFQHLPLHKDLTFLIDPPRDNKFCLPAGPYREPHGNRRRADILLEGQFEIVTDPLSFELPDGSELDPHCSSVSVLCALAEPSGFLRALDTAGVRIEGSPRLLPDHDPLDAGNLFDGLPSRLPIVVTMKDWVKLRERSDVDSRTFWIARHQVRVESEDALRRRIADKLNEFTTKEA